jgi:hypothetical protein
MVRVAGFVVPESAPLQPVNTWFGLGVAVRVTTVPAT